MMLYFILKTPSESGSYGNIFQQMIIDGMQLPNEYYEEYIKYKGFVKFTFNDIGEIVRMEPNEEALNEYLSYTEPLDKMFDYEQEIQALTESLNADQDKITQCMEAFMTGEEMPYDYKSLISKRNKIRNRIKELETLLEPKDSLIQAFEEWNQKKIEENSPKKGEVIYKKEV